MNKVLLKYLSLAVLLVGHNVQASDTNVVLPDWVENPTLEGGYATMTIHESEEQGVIANLMEISMQQRAYSPESSIDKAEKASEELVSSAKFGEALTVTSAYSRREVTKRSTIVINVKFKQGELYRAYKYYAEVVDGQPPIEVFNIENNGVDYSDMREYMLSNGFVIQSYQQQENGKSSNYLFTGYKPQQLNAN